MFPTVTGEKELEDHLIWGIQNILIEKLQDIDTYAPVLICRLKERCTASRTSQ